jgi:hypothetical protein
MYITSLQLLLHALRIITCLRLLADTSMCVYVCQCVLYIIMILVFTRPPLRKPLQNELNDLGLRLALVCEDAYLSIIHINHIFRLISYIEAEAFADRTVPRSSKFFIHGGLD